MQAGDEPAAAQRGAALQLVGGDRGVEVRGWWQGAHPCSLQPLTLTSFSQVEIKDIVWPGEALKPPEGVPEKRFLSITFLEEDPYIMLNSPTTCTGATKGTICQIVPDWDLEGVNITEEVTNPNSTKFKCCSGFCVDLIRKFSVDLAFDYALKRVKDGQWGGIVNGSWNGLVAELIRHETDLVMTSLKINSARESVIDFSVPFLETGITILVSKRTGIMSPTGIYGLCHYNDGEYLFSSPSIS